MQQELAQITVMSALYLMNITSPEKGVQQRCHIEDIRPVRFEKMTLFKGTWRTLKCIPSTYCSNIACAEYHFEQNDGKGILLHASNYNISSGKALTIEGKIQIIGPGRFAIEADYPHLRGAWNMMGTDYKNYWIMHGCIRGKSYFVINSREDKLKDSVKPEVQNHLTKYGLNLSRFSVAASPPNGKDCKSLVAKVGQEKKFQEVPQAKEEPVPNQEQKQKGQKEQKQQAKQQPLAKSQTHPTTTTTTSFK